MLSGTSSICISTFCKVLKSIVAAKTSSVIRGSKFIELHYVSFIFWTITLDVCVDLESVGACFTLKVNKVAVSLS